MTGLTRSIITTIVIPKLRPYIPSLASTFYPQRDKIWWGKPIAAKVQEVEAVADLFIVRFEVTVILGDAGGLC